MWVQPEIAKLGSLPQGETPMSELNDTLVTMDLGTIADLHVSEVFLSDKVSKSGLIKVRENYVSREFHASCH